MLEEETGGWSGKVHSQSVGTGLRVYRLAGVSKVCLGHTNRLYLVFTKARQKKIYIHFINSFLLRIKY